MLAFPIADVESDDKAAQVSVGLPSTGFEPV